MTVQSYSVTSMWRWLVLAIGLVLFLLAVAGVAAGRAGCRVGGRAVEGQGGPDGLVEVPFFGRRTDRLPVGVRKLKAMVEEMAAGVDNGS